MGCPKLTYRSEFPTLKVAHRDVEILAKSCAGYYRYGFNGQEKDDEVSGSGNRVNFKFRSYDPRIGRFFAVDPLAKTYPMLTPYQFASNSPIMNVDVEGLEGSYSAGWIKQKVEATLRTASDNINETIEATAEIMGEGKDAFVDAAVATGDGFAYMGRAFARWDASLEGRSDPANTWTMGTTEKRVSSATFNTVVGGGSVVGEIAAAPETGGASLIGLPYSTDQFAEGIAEFKALLTGTYDDNKVYGPLRNATYQASEKYLGDKKYGVYAFNLGGIVTGGIGGLKSLKNIKSWKANYFDVNTVVGATEGVTSDSKDIAEEVERTEYVTAP